MELEKSLSSKSEFTINLLGYPSIFKNGNDIHFTRHKSIGLLAYLADTKQKVSRINLSKIFWPDSNPAQSLGSLRTVLAEIKSNLGPNLIILEKDLIYMHEEKFVCDIEQFRKNLKNFNLISELKKIETI